MPVCRYCGKPLPFFQRFSAEEAFCSKEHRQAYQEEFNRLALSRLLQQAAGRVKGAPAAMPAPVAVPGPKAHRPGAGASVPEPVGVAAAAPQIDSVRRTLSARLPPAPAIPLAEPQLRSFACGGVGEPCILWPVGWVSLTLFAKTLDLAEQETPEAVEEGVAVIPAPESQPTLLDSEPPLAGPLKLEFALRSPSDRQTQDLLWPGLPPHFPRFDAAPLRAQMFFGNREETAPEPEPEPEAAVEAPDFSLAARGNVWSRLPWVARAALFAAIALAGALAVWKSVLQTSAPVAKPASQVSATGVLRAVSMGAGGWITKEVSGAAASQRAISLYRPSMELTDYSIEFTGRIEQGGLGWVARLKDTGNYYAMRLERQGGALEMVRWVVTGGADAEPVRVPAGPAPDLLRVRLDARGPRLVTSLGGQEVDSFVDHRLPAGGFGFFNEQGFRGRVESVQFFVSSR